MQDHSELRQYLEKKLQPSQNNSQNPLIKDFFEIINYHHRSPVELTAPDIIKSLIQNLLSCGVGGTAAWAYVNASINAARGNPINIYFNPIGAYTLNLILNVFFFNEVTSAVLEKIIDCCRKGDHKNFQNALDHLRHANPTLSVKLKHYLKQAFTFSMFLGISFMAGYPSLALAETESNDPRIILGLIFTSSAMLQYKGVEAFAFKMLPILLSPFHSIHQRFSKNEKNKALLQQKIGLLKKNHILALESALDNLLGMMQKRQTEELQPFYDLLEKDQSMVDSALLLFSICQLSTAPPFQNKINKKRAFSQLLGEILTAISLPGFTIRTKNEAAKFFKLTEKLYQWIVGIAITSPSNVLAADVSWTVVGNLYDLSAYALKGIKESWQSRQSFTSFISNGIKGMFNQSSWHRILQLPLHFQQNPKTLLIPLLILYILCYPSTSTTVYLNQEELKDKNNIGFDIATMVAVMFFNGYPVDKVLGSAQRFCIKIAGSDLHKRQLKLQECIQNHIASVHEMDDARFLEALCDIAVDDQLNSQVNELFYGFFGNKTTADMFGVDDELSHLMLPEAIKQLTNDKIEHFGKSSRFNLSNYFFRRKQPTTEATPLLVNTVDEEKGDVFLSSLQ